MTTQLEQIIKDVWFGRESLLKVFWLYKVAIGGLIGVLFETLFTLKDFRTLSVIVLAFYLVYHIWVLKGLIACKDNLKKFHFISNIVIYFVGINAFVLCISIFNVFSSLIKG